MYDVERNAEQSRYKQEQECRCGADCQRPFSVWLRATVKARVAVKEREQKTAIH